MASSMGHLLGLAALKILSLTLNYNLTKLKWSKLGGDKSLILRVRWVPVDLTNYLLSKHGRLWLWHIDFWTGLRTVMSRNFPAFVYQLEIHVSSAYFPHLDPEAHSKHGIGYDQNGAQQILFNFFAVSAAIVFWNWNTNTLSIIVGIVIAAARDTKHVQLAYWAVYLWLRLLVG